MQPKDIILNNSNLQFVYNVYIKRYVSNTGFEDDWLDVSDFVMRLPDIHISYMDLIYHGNFLLTTTSIIFDNNNSKFSPGGHPLSFFYNIVTDQRIKLKLEILYINENKDITHYKNFYYIGSNPTFDIKSTKFSLISPLNILKTQTAYNQSFNSMVITDILEQLLTIKDKNGVEIFAKYSEPAVNKFIVYSDNLELTNFKINKADTIYKTTCDLLNILDAYIFINDDGAFEISSRQSKNNDIYGFSAYNNSNGFDPNIISYSLKSGIENQFSSIEITYKDNNILYQKSPYTVNDNSIEDIYGNRIFKLDNEYLDFNQATIVANRFLNKYSQIRRRIELESTPVILDLSDQVHINIENTLKDPLNTFIKNVSSKVGGSTGDKKASYVGSYNIQGYYKVIDIKIDINNSSYKYILEEE